MLVLDHSHATLTATLGVTTECLLDVRRILSSEKLGARGLRELSWWEFDSEAERVLLLQQRYPMLIGALRRLIALPLDPLGGNLPGGEDVTAVDRLVLLGETADDENLHTALREVFGDRLGALLASSGWNSSMTKNDPLYTAAESVARCSLGSKKLSSERTEL